MTAVATPQSDSRSLFLVRRLSSRLFAVAGFLVAWKLVLEALRVPPFLVPPPENVWSAIATSLQRNPVGRGSFLSAAWATYSAAGMAFILASVVGFGIALALAKWRWLERAINPYIVAFQTLPRIAIAPLFLIWFGQGRPAKVYLATLVAFFPVLVNSLAGLKSTPPEWIEWMRMQGASSRQIFWTVRARYASPYVFAGLEVALVFSILGVVVTEFVGSRSGLGVLILQSHYAVDVAGVFAVFVVLIGFGLIFRLGLSLTRKRLLFWAEREVADTGK